MQAMRKREPENAGVVNDDQDDREGAEKIETRLCSRLAKRGSMTVSRTESRMRERSRAVVSVESSHQESFSSCDREVAVSLSIRRFSTFRLKRAVQSAQ